MLLLFSLFFYLLPCLALQRSKKKKTKRRGSTTRIVGSAADDCLMPFNATAAPALTFIIVRSQKHLASKCKDAIA